MPFRFDPAESVPDGVRRIAREQLDRSIHRLTEGTDDRDADVHSARKSMKCLRGLVRLVRPDLGPEVYRRENETYRDTARRLAGLRDATVLAGTLDRVVGGLNGEAGDFDPLREQLAGRRGRAYESGERGPVLDACAEALRQARDRVDRWPVDDAGWSGLGRGVLAVYRRGRREFGEACWRPSVESLHEWRKRVKYLWYHSRLLQPLWPGLMTAWQKELDRLGELLGDDHDLAVLAGVLRQRGEVPPDRSCWPPSPGAATSCRRRPASWACGSTPSGPEEPAPPPAGILARLGGGEAPGPAAAAGPDSSLTTASSGSPTPAAARGRGPSGTGRSSASTGSTSPRGASTGTIPPPAPTSRSSRGSRSAASRCRPTARCCCSWPAAPSPSGGRGQPLSPVVEEIPVERESRFNDVIADPEGRVFCGTMPGPDGGGRLYRLDRDGTLTELLDGVGLPNGMDFSPDGRLLYFVDSKAGIIWRFDYDRATGELAGRRPFADAGGLEGGPTD